MNPESGIFPISEAIATEASTPAANEQWKFDEARRLMPQEKSEAEAATPEKLDPALVERIKAKQQRMAEMAARVDASMAAGDRDEHAVAMGARVDAAMAEEQRSAKNAARLAELLKDGEQMRARMTAEYYAKKNAGESASSEQAARAAVEEAADSGNDPLEKAA